jgi:hypothetical protein
MANLIELVFPVLVVALENELDEGDSAGSGSRRYLHRSEMGLKQNSFLQFRKKPIFDCRKSSLCKYFTGRKLSNFLEKVL